MELWTEILVCGILALAGMVVMVAAAGMIAPEGDLWCGSTDVVATSFYPTTRGKVLEIVYLNQKKKNLEF